MQVKTKKSKDIFEDKMMRLMGSNTQMKTMKTIFNLSKNMKKTAFKNKRTAVTEIITVTITTTVMT